MTDSELLWRVFPYFFLGHLFGDYVFQTGYIARYKSNKLLVLVEHVFIVFLCQLASLAGRGFGATQLFSVVALSGVHMGVDLVKKKCKTEFCRSWIYYLVDQGLHVLSFIPFMFFFRDVAFFVPRTVAVVASVMVFNGYFIGILVHLMTSDKEYRRDYVGYVLRMLAPVLYLLGTRYFLVYAVAMMVVTVRYSKKKKSVLFDYLFSVTSTIILLEVML